MSWRRSQRAWRNGPFQGARAGHRLRALLTLLVAAYSFQLSDAVYLTRLFAPQVCAMACDSHGGGCCCNLPVQAAPGDGHEVGHGGHAMHDAGSEHGADHGQIHATHEEAKGADTAHASGHGAHHGVEATAANQRYHAAADFVAEQPSCVSLCLSPESLRGPNLEQALAVSDSLLGTNSGRGPPTRFEASAGPDEYNPATLPRSPPRQFLS